MFLKNITINNYKSIQKATASFEDGLNIVIGKNGAGKSNLLEFIDLFVSYNLVNTGSKINRNIKSEYDFTICYRIEDADYALSIYLKRLSYIINGSVEYRNELKLAKKKDQNIISQETFIVDPEDTNTTEFMTFLKEIEFIKKFYRELVPFDIPKECPWLDKRNSFEINSDLVLLSDGFPEKLNIIFELNIHFENEFREYAKKHFLTFDEFSDEGITKMVYEIFEKFNEELQINSNLYKFSPIHGIRLNPNINIYSVDNKILVENLLIDFKVNDSWVPWSYLSDGSKRLFYLITQCLSLKDGLLLIEEPELGVHPHQLYSLMTFLKEQSADKQIIISTHSPIVLDILKPDELNRITIAKLEKNGSQFYKLTDEQKALAQEYMRDVADLSDYWFHSDLENNYAATND